MKQKLIALTLLTAVLTACGGSGAEAEPAPKNAYQQTNLSSDTATLATFSPALADFAARDDFINAWGIAIRPAGAGGHFWVTAGQYSYQFVGDVKTSADPSLRNLFQDALRLVDIPGAGGGAFSTGTVFNGAPIDSDKFVVTNQPVSVGGVNKLLTGSARFLFATDSGVISGWTERDPSNPGTPVRADGPALAMIDDSANGAAFFGVALKTDTWDTLWAADFGAQPRLRQYNHLWQEVPLSGFANPFATGVAGAAQPGDYVPFNVQTLKVGGVDRVFVAYAKSQADPANPSQFLAAEEDALDAANEGETPSRGKVVMYDLNGQLLRTFDNQRLNAPWGVAVASANFGPLSNALLVGNFGGSGRIAAYNINTGAFIDWLRKPDGKPVAIAGLWGLQFGNGASLGDANALYFAAGPGDESQGLFGVLRPSF